MTDTKPSGEEKEKLLDCEVLSYPQCSSDENDNSGDSDEFAETKRLNSPENSESFFQILCQTSLSFIFAGMGLVVAGLVFSKYQTLPFFNFIPELVVIVPTLLGLKGNLEMTLASRLSTQVNLHALDDKAVCASVVIGNLILVQVQAITIACVSSFLAASLTWVISGVFRWKNIFILLASSVLTTSVAGIIIGCLISGIVIASYKCNWNPDNLAAPFAAGLGDFVTLTILMLFSSFILKFFGPVMLWILMLILILFFSFLPVSFYISSRNIFVRDALFHGWSPIIAAMVISSFGGLILDYSVRLYKGVALLQPVFNGAGGNLAAIQASRLSTELHKRKTSPKKSLIHKFFPYLGQTLEARTARVLLTIIIPGHLLLFLTLWIISDRKLEVSFLFLILYLGAAVLQVSVLMILASWMTNFAWKRGWDPDNVCIPYLTALGDILGIIFLFCVFSVTSNFK